MTITTTAPTTRSAKLFVTAFTLALEHRHQQSDEYLELAHEMRALEEHIALIAQHASSELALLLVKAALTDFTEDVDASEYLETNREPIQFYAENDAQLRALINAAFNPLPYKRDEVRLTESELVMARSALDEWIKLSPDVGQTSDPLITPAAIALKARGFKAFTRPSGSAILRSCPECKGHSSTKVHYNERIYWHCPHCNLAKEA
jgi:hypothetical protein